MITRRRSDAAGVVRRHVADDARRRIRRKNRGKGTTVGKTTGPTRVTAPVVEPTAGKQTIVARIDKIQASRRIRGELIVTVTYVERSLDETAARGDFANARVAVNDKFASHRRIARAVGTSGHREPFLGNEHTAATALVGRIVVVARISVAKTVIRFDLTGAIRRFIVAVGRANKARNDRRKRRSARDVARVVVDPRNRPFFVGTTFNVRHYAVVNSRLFAERHNEERAAPDVAMSDVLVGATATETLTAPTTRRERPVRVVIILKPERKLFEIISALHSARGFASGLHGGKKQADQNTDDRNYYKQFHECEGVISCPPPRFNICLRAIENPRNRIKNVSNRRYRDDKTILKNVVKDVQNNKRIIHDSLNVVKISRSNNIRSFLSINELEFNCVSVTKNNARVVGFQSFAKPPGSERTTGTYRVALRRARKPPALRADGRDFTRLSTKQVH